MGRLPLPEEILADNRRIRETGRTSLTQSTRCGEMLICVDDEDRENEGDLICAAEKINLEMVNFMAVHARGLICMPITADRANQLMLPAGE